VSTDPTTVPGANGHRTSADHFRTAEMNGASALAAHIDGDAARFARHMELAKFHGQMAATLIVASGRVSPEDARAELSAWTDYFRDNERRARAGTGAAAKPAEERPTSRVRGLPS
jgi:hypothetical protein